ncbi:MAG TPA: NosD domain-containing protein [Methanothrix sp.]|nr:NosD domain-containing protein [Methanothrix sp.]
MKDDERCFLRQLLREVNVRQVLKFKIYIILLILIVSAAIGNGEDVVVVDYRNNDESDNIYRTISDGIEHVDAEGTVIVKNGIYKENLQINKPLTLAGETIDDQEIEIQPQSPSLYVITVLQRNVVIRNMTINGGKGGIYAYEADKLQIIDNNIVSCNQGIVMEETNDYQIFLNFLDDVDIGINLKDCTCGDIEDNDFSVSILGIILESSRENGIYNNSIGSDTDGISLVDRSVDNIIENNTLICDKCKLYLKQNIKAKNILQDFETETRIKNDAAEVRLCLN